MTLFLTSFFPKKNSLNEILFERIVFLQSSTKKRYILIILLNYLNKKGKKCMFEIIVFRLLFLLKKTSLLKTKYLFNKNESCFFILHQAFFNVMPSFKLLIKNKKEYIPISFSDLIKDHSKYLNSKALLDDHKSSKYSPNRLKKLKKLKKLSDSKNPLNLMINTKIIPVPLYLSSRCLQSCSFLIKSLIFYKDTFSFVEKLYKEIILAYYCCGRSFYLKTEVDKIACFHKSNIQF